MRLPKITLGNLSRLCAYVCVLASARLLLQCLRRDDQSPLEETWLSSNAYAVKPKAQLEVQQKALLPNMCALELKAVIRRKRPSYVKATEIHVTENVMNHNFDARSPNSKWSTDVTELKYGNGRKAYLSAIIDVYDNYIVSWILSHSNNNKLVMDTLKKAYEKNPDVSPLLHSDRGFQYTSHEYNRLYVKYGFMKSMSRVSRCLDNQPIERFWGTYKSESYYLTKYDTYEDVLKDVSKYIHYYNNYRYTECLGGLSPNEYRRAE